MKFKNITPEQEATLRSPASKRMSRAHRVDMAFMGRAKIANLFRRAGINLHI